MTADQLWLVALVFYLASMAAGKWLGPSIPGLVTWGILYFIGIIFTILYFLE